MNTEMKMPKDNDKSRLFRSAGNFHFAKKIDEGYSSALKCYNKAICFAPSESENLCLAYANRSAVYFKLGKHKECLDNINLVYRINNYPSRLWDKLKQREIKCLTFILENDLSTEDDRIEPTLNFSPHDKVPCIREQYGHHIVTNCDLNIAEIVAILKPFCAAIPENYQYQRCENCFSEYSQNLIPCTSCTAVMFCGEQCMKEAMDGFHKYECLAIDLINRVFPCQQDKLALRVVVTWGLSIFQTIDQFLDISEKVFKQNVTIFDIDHNVQYDQYAVVGSLKKAKNTDTLKSDIKNLFSVCSRILTAGNIVSTKEPKEFNRMFYNILKQHLIMVEMNSSFFDYLSCRVVNKDLTSQDEKEIINNMSGIYPFIHLLPHSSSPNVLCISENRIITSVVLRPIKAGEQLFNRAVHYHNTMTCLPVHSKEVESEDENGDGWLQQKTKLMIDELSDVNYGEKELMKMWNVHIIRYGCWCWAWRRWCSPRDFRARSIKIGEVYEEKFPPNKIRNQKYNFITFLPLVLFEQFRFFLNLYFLIMALSQFIPDIRIGYLYTYWGPLGFVLTVTICREAIDDLRRHKRDREVNSQKYTKLSGPNQQTESVPSSKLNLKTHEMSLFIAQHTPFIIRYKVGDIIIVEKDERVPADLVLLRTSDKSGAESGSVFVRTDQLDGETDWKLRLAVPATQKLANDSELFNIDATIYIEKPQMDIHSFIGTFAKQIVSEESLDVENTLWANTVVAAGTATGIVVYTGCETRSVMNNSQPRSKVGLLDMEINGLTKVLFCAVIGLSLAMMCLKGFNGPWYRYMFRFVLLFSYIIPISLRVNLDMGKAFYSYQIQNDPEIQGTVVRSTTIPEELGRISYLLTDKTGTLTQNEMVFKKIHLGTVAYGNDSFDEVASTIQALSSNINPSDISPIKQTSVFTATRMRRPEGWRVWEAVRALALCHNVTPVYDNKSNEVENKRGSPTKRIEIDSEKEEVTYQASSPDEIALVKWTEQIGLALVARNLNSMTLQLRNPFTNPKPLKNSLNAENTSINTAVTILSNDSSKSDINSPSSSTSSTASLNSLSNGIMKYSILQVFPFTSESKRMGIIVKDAKTGEITFYLKGADVVMAAIVQYNDWLNEESGNMAREGLRTLVIAKKVLTEDQYNDFETRYNAARLSVTDRIIKVSAVIESLEREMELLCLTGVEDRLQDRVRPTLELLRNAGIKIWMLTGDKLETATCIAKSSHLVGRNQGLHVLKSVLTRTDAHLELNQFRRKQDCALVVSGESLEVCLQYYQDEFMELATASPAVVCCRCSPTQKAQVVSLIQKHTGKRACAVGDGGNDVSMIQQSDAGVGIEGREGRQASLAGDFSIPSFSYISKLLLVHGRRSYKRSAALSQFFIHRGLIISTMQAVFSAVFYLSSVALYQALLQVGYATLYTMFPVFSLILDQDISSYIAVTNPELYKELSKGRSLSYKTFFMWVLISIYQGGVIMYGALILFEDEFIHIVAISFSALILTELIMVALTIRTWHRLMVLAEIFSLILYIISLAVLHEYFDWEFIWSWDFLWKVSVIALVSCLPLYVIKFLRKKFSPPSYSKLS